MACRIMARCPIKPAKRPTDVAQASGRTRVMTTLRMMFFAWSGSCFFLFFFVVSSRPTSPLLCYILNKRGIEETAKGKVEVNRKGVSSQFHRGTTTKKTSHLQHSHSWAEGLTDRFTAPFSFVASHICAALSSCSIFSIIEAGSHARANVARRLTHKGMRRRT